MGGVSQISVGYLISVWSFYATVCMQNILISYPDILLTLLLFSPLHSKQLKKMAEPLIIAQSPGSGFKNPTDRAFVTFYFSVSKAKK